MKVIVGLGNPGAQYQGTRHNVGFDAIDTLAESLDLDRFQKKFASEVAEARHGGEKLLLVKPQKYMNLSGVCVRQAIDFYQVDLEDLLVIVDDFNLPLGKIRVRPRGSHGGHNGLRDIQGHLGTNEYPRIRIGVDAPKRAEAVDHVLKRFRPDEHDIIEDAILKAVQATVVWVEYGIEESMNRFNGDPEKPKKKKKAPEQESTSDPPKEERSDGEEQNP